MSAAFDFRKCKRLLLSSLAVILVVGGSAAKPRAIADCAGIPLPKQQKTRQNLSGFLWRRKRDSNPRGLSPKRFSRPPRYDRFDIPPLCMPGKNNTNRGQDAVFLTNTALRSRLRHKVLTRSRALSLPENTASDSQATKPPIFPMIFGKNERSCTLSVLQASFCQKARKLRRFGKACITLAWHIG